MTAEFVVEVFRKMLSTALLLTLPMLLTAMLVGIVVSLLQAVTSIQEQTLSFIPKLVAVALLMMFLAFWIIENLVSFTNEMFNRMSSIPGS